MELSDRDRKVLWTRARNVCSFPQCRQRLTQDQVDAATGEAFQTVIGEEAHIYSASSKGPRYDANYPISKLETYENRILLCRNHHRLIDSEKGRAYDPETLIGMKRRHERQEERRERISATIRGYIADQYVADDQVLFRQVKLEGPKVDEMFVDVPFAARHDADAAELLGQIAADRPGDAEAEAGWVVAGAAQALLHPDWSGNALVVGGPGQGKSTLLQYLCQFHRARHRGAGESTGDYTGQAQGLQPLTETTRIPVRIDLRDYARWASSSKARVNKRPAKRKRSDLGRRLDEADWPSLEEYIAVHVTKHSGGRRFSLKDVSTLVSTEPVLLALDGLDEVANLEHRDQVASEIVRAAARLRADAADLVVVVATRPGLSGSPLWSSADFPVFYLQRLTAGLRLQYLQRWCKVAALGAEAAVRLQRTFVEHEGLPHIRDLASYPMQLAILLHLLQRRGLLPQERTELYSEYLKAFLDREETEDKEPLLSSERDVIEDIHAFLGWYLHRQAEDDGTNTRQIARADLKRLLNQHLAGREKGLELANQLFSAMESRVLCLIEREPGFFQFEVQSLQEYFAAAYINEYADPRGAGNSRVDCLDALLARPYWLNACRFFVGMFTKMEVRGINHSLRELQATPALSLHPHLRLAAGRLLDDRAYQGQPDATLQEIVDFVLAGPGVVLAEDGHLDESGQPLTFAEDAGRSQAVRALKKRLADETVGDVRAVAARMLRRHANDHGELARWWWDHLEARLGTPPATSTESLRGTSAERSRDWLRTAADLGVLELPDDPPVAALAAAVTSAASEDGEGAGTQWVSECLVGGGYAGSADDVLRICVDEINDGAGDVVPVGSATPLCRIVEAARVAQARFSAGGTEGAGARTRFRRATGRSLVADLLNGTEQIRSRPDADPSAWAARLKQVARLWGDGWVLRQAVALVPATVDLAHVARVHAGADPVLAELLDQQLQIRANRADANWWRSARERATSDLEQRAWLFSVLTAAHSQVVISLAAEITASSEALIPKHYRAMEAALHAFTHSPLLRRLTLQDALRLGQVTYGPRTLWLMRPIATEAAAEQINKKIVAGLGDLLAPGMGDRRQLLEVIGAERTVKIDALRGTRRSLPPGTWAAAVKLGAMTARISKVVLEHPEEYPIDIVARAVQQASDLLGELPAIAEVARMNNWFQAAPTT
ncbi:hypothetical protein AB0F43_31960 [Kribbella sp. NPDC023972]|uniref:NACHT domain-containing protein n=1 Tax=Kribbella sp. NPDC023972 TaxID=3154795 RepID=UPI0033D38E7F